MKILILSFSYFPSLTPRAFRWTAIAEHWARQGHQVDVVCELSPGRARSEVVGSVRIHRVGSDRLAGFSAQPAARLKSDQPAKFDKLRDAARGALGQVGRRVWRATYWPDYACLWYRHGVVKAKALQAENQYDAMYSSSIPFTGHLVALGVKKMQPDLQWLADIGDPFCFSEGIPVNNFAIYQNLNIRYEGKVFAGAQAIAVTTNATAQRYTSIFPGAAAKITVVPPLLSVSPAQVSPGTPVQPSHGTVRLVFLGTLYKMIRDPTDLLRFFSRLVGSGLSGKMELHFYGDISSCAESFKEFQSLLGTHLFLHGLVDRRAAAQAMEQADILVNIGNDTTYQLPSKVVEYLAAMKPVLNFARSANDSSAAFLRGYDGVLCIVADEAVRVPACFRAAAEFVCNPPGIDVVQRRTQLETFSIDRIAGAYQHLLDWDHSSARMPLARGRQL